MSRVKALIARLRSDPGFALALSALLAALIVYAPTLSYGLVNHDDPWLVLDNRIVQDASLSSLRRIFFAFDVESRAMLGAEYLPVRDLSVMADFALWGDWFGGFHLSNLLVYLASIWLWFAALARFGVDRRVAGLAVLLWAVHPSHAESVAWISERKGLLAMMFAAATVLGYARFRRGAHASWLVLAAVCAVCAIWSKALAAFAVAALVPLELVLRADRVSTRRAVVGLTVIAVVAGLAFIPILNVAIGLSVVADASGNRLVGAVGLMGFYSRLGLMMMPNAISYELATIGPSVADIAIGVTVLLASVAALLSPHRALRAASVLWLLGWFPVSRLLLPVKVVVVADRYLLFPSLGLAIALAVGIQLLPRRRLAIALAATLVVAGMLRSLDARGSWRDKLALWERAVASNPLDGDNWSSYIQALSSSGQPEQALVTAERAVTIAPSPRVQMQLALLVLRTDRPRALALMRAAADGGFPHAMSNLAQMLARDGQLEEALFYARRATQLLPVYAPGFHALGVVELAASHTSEALIAFERAADLEPTCMNLTFVARALDSLGRADEARARRGNCPP